MAQASWQPKGGQQTVPGSQAVVVVLHWPFTHADTLQPIAAASVVITPP